MKRVIQRIRSWGISQTAGLMNLAGKIHYKDLNPPIGWKDHLRWWLEGLLMIPFAWAYDGSDEEIEAVYRSEIPTRYMSTRQRAVLTLPRSEYGAHCCHCAWDGWWSEVSLDEVCPNCGDTVYLDPFDGSVPALFDVPEIRN